MSLGVGQDIVNRYTRKYLAKRYDAGKWDGYGVSTQVMVAPPCGEEPSSCWTLESTFFLYLLLPPSFHIALVTMVKRKHEATGADSNGSARKTAKSQSDVHANFGDKLFDPNVVTKYRDDYAKSGPYVA